MRPLLFAVLAVLALLAAAGAGLLLLGRGPAPPAAGGGTGGGSGAGPATGTDAAAGAGEGSPEDGGAPGGAGGGPGRRAGGGGADGEAAAGTGAPAVPARRPDGDDAPVTPREGVPPGEIPILDVGPEEFEKLEEARRAVAETDLGRVAWRRRPLREVADDLAERSGLAVELDGEGLGDEPVTMEGDRVKARQVLDHVAVSRALRFEIRPGKVVIRR